MTRKPSICCPSICCGAAQARFATAIAAIETEYRGHLVRPIEAQTPSVYVDFWRRLERLDDAIDKAYGCNHLELREMVRLRERTSKLNADIAVSREAAAKDADRRRFEAEVVAQGWPADIAIAVLQRKIRIGMTDAQVRMAWGNPERIHETVSGYGTREQWIYPGGKLETVQRSR